MPHALARNIEFWHWYPELLVRDLEPAQLRWQPDAHDTTILFALWHTYRAADDLVHGWVLRTPSVFTREGWATRLAVGETGATPFGNGLSREQIARIDLDIDELLAYAKSVGASINAAIESLTPEQAAEDVALPFFANAYPGYDHLPRLEAIVFFAIGHTSEHLGEVQMIRGMMGLKGAPL